LRKTWKLLKTVINCDSENINSIKEIKSNDTTLKNPVHIANAFNNYFVGIGPTLASKINPSSAKPADYLPIANPKSMFLRPIDQIEIKSIVTNLKANASSGDDSILPKIVRSIIEYIQTPLCTIFNKSLEQGCFPDKLKIARVIPIYKTDDEKLVSNYRPISVLPFFSKILEKIMYNRLISFINDSEILINNQYGFREKHSTYMALLNLTDRITNELDCGNHSLGIFIDLSKAFDTLDHSILLSKLQHYGVRGTACDWFTSYLQNRKQFVNIGSEVSDTRIIKCGVPQGSILGPLLFILYINDIVNVSDLCSLILFADDTNIFLSNNNLKSLIDTANIELAKFSTWFKANKLSLNVKKTNFIIFRNKNKQIDNDIEIKIDNAAISQVANTKFLGVIINQDLTWNDHIKVILNKIAKSIGVIRRVSHNLSKDVLLSLYHTLVQPYLDYCNIVWASGHSGLIEKLQIAQKRIVRIVCNLSWNAHTRPTFLKLNILHIVEINTFQIGCFMYRAMKGLLPSHLMQYFTPTNAIHSHYTRHCNDLYLSRHRTSIRADSIRIRGVKVWNAVTTSIQQAPSFPIFKKNFKYFVAHQ
jgi:hypothetical protein